MPPDAFVAEHDVAFGAEPDRIFILLERHPHAVMQAVGDLKLRQGRLRT